MNHLAALDALASYFRIRLDANRANSCAAARDRLASALREVEDLTRRVERLEGENERLQCAARQAVLCGYAFRDDGRDTEWFSGELERIQGLIRGAA